MNKILSILLVSILCFVLPSCGDDNGKDDPTEEAGIVGIWKYSDEYDSLLTFEKNGTCIFVEYGPNNIIYDKVYGSYSLNGKILTIVMDGEVEFWTILTLTDNVLTMRYEGEYVGEYLNWEEGTDIMTYIRVE